MNTSWKTLAFSGLLVFSMLSSGCIDVLKEFYFKANGSGSVKSEWNYAEMGAMLKQMSTGIEINSTMDENGEFVEDEDGKSEDLEAKEFDKNPFPDFDEMLKKLEAIPGISNVISLQDVENFIVGYTYDFANMEALNAAETITNKKVNAQLSADGEDTDKIPSFEFDGKKLITRGNMELDEPDDPQDKQARGMLLSAYNGHPYQIKYSFDQEVKKVKKNKNAVIGPDGKSVVLEVDLGELFKGDASLNNQILLKK